MTSQGKEQTADYPSEEIAVGIQETQEQIGQLRCP